jgi:hypothetical protein
MKYLSFFLVVLLFACADESNQRPAPDIELAGFSSIKQLTDVQGNTFKTGYEQKSDGSFQNPFIEKMGKDGKRIWKIYYEQSSVDGRGVMLALDTDGLTPVAVFTVDGGSYDDAYITKHMVIKDAFSGVYQSSYAAGGGPKVSIIAKINPESGMISKATFLTARKNDGKTNGFGVDEIKVTPEAIILKTTTWAWPPGEGKAYSKFPEITDADRIDGWFKMYYEISHDLSSIKRAEIFVN